MVESARKAVRVGEKEHNECVVVKAVVRRKEAVWKEFLIASDEETKERHMEAYREEKRKVKRCMYQNKKKVNEQFGRM